VSQQTTNRTFDELAREMASGSISRGKSLKLMGAALLGGTLASLGMGEASAHVCQPDGNACKKDAQCCSGTCEGGQCAAAAACIPTNCHCTTSTECCSGHCSNGVCCPSGQVGLGRGTCAIPCSSPADCPCGGECVTYQGSSSQMICARPTAPERCFSDTECDVGWFCSSNLECEPACTRAGPGPTCAP
jgi:hypothetical protein